MIFCPIIQALSGYAQINNAWNPAKKALSLTIRQYPESLVPRSLSEDASTEYPAKLFTPATLANYSRLNIIISMIRGKKALVLLVSIPLLGFLLWHIGLCIFRCYAYKKVVLSRPNALANLSGKPGTLEIPQDSNTPILSLGYALANVPSESINAITVVDDSSIIVATEEFKLLFIPPWASTWSTTDSNSIRSSTLPSIFSKDPFGYDFGFKAANTMSKSYFEIFFMQPKEFMEFLFLASAKAQNVMNQNGISTFETKNIRGIVRFGLRKSPGVLAIEVFCKEANICQDIRIISQDPAKSKEVLLSLLSSYKFLISEVPDENSLRELILTEIKKHEKFQEWK